MANGILVQVVLPSIDAVPADEIENTLAFDCDPTNSVFVTAVLNSVTDFFTATAAGAVNPVGFWMGPRIDRTSNACVARAYDISAHLDGSPHGAPISFATFTMPLAGSSRGIGDQVAAVVRYRGSYAGTAGELGPYQTEPVPESAQDYGAPATITGPVPGSPKVAQSHPRARLRGRFFLGPLNHAIIDTDATGNSRISAGGGTDIDAAALALFDANSGGGRNWSVWSRRNAALAHIVRDTVRHDESPHVIRRRTHRF